MEGEAFLGATLARGFAPDSVHWPLVRSSILFELRYGKALVEASRRSGPVPVFGTNGRCGSHDTALFEGPGVVCGRKGQGPLGVEWVDSDYWVIDTAYSLRPLRDDVDLKFAYYLIKYVGLNHLKDGTSNPSLSRDTFGSQLFPMPPLAEQRAIARILGALDDKIELNRRMNETLEAMARALFKSWFVDFDPVRAKAQGRPPRGMDAETAKLFPNKLVESELGPSPQGWSVSSIYALCTVDYGAPYASSRFNMDKRGLPVVRIRDLAEQTPTIWTDEDHPRAVQLADGDIVVGMDGEFRSHVWGSGPALLNQRACRFSPRDSRDGTYVRFSVGPCLEFVERTEVATTVIHLGKSDIDQFRIVLPSRAVLDRFAIAAGPLIEGQIVARHESRSLARLRDTLLPRLLSGELSVAAAERAVEQVA